MVIFTQILENICTEWSFHRENSVRSSQADSCIIWLKYANYTLTLCRYITWGGWVLNRIWTVFMEMELFSEMLVCFKHL